MKLSDEEAILWGAMMYLAGQTAERGGGAVAASGVTAEQTRKAKGIAAETFESFKRKAKQRREVVQ